MAEPKAYAGRSDEAARLVKALLATSMTATQIAAEINVGERAVYRWRTGTAPHPIVLESLRKLAAKKGVEL